ncbi:DUF262 domain-containing protein [Adlercreutzia murintestinalis]|uniref:DUF262 domain-containing protein n=1 Tax=Adlercreutzia murintestinalis TaxID=2941325 RepID=UPI00204040B3|nr:DUF262 domain-containing protein [Adlercreutzia murintestinalis]
MIAKETGILDVLGIPDSQFIVPVFQRVYSWTARECEDLIDDVLAAGAAERAHFTGSFLYAPCASEENGIRAFQIIDGQQRMTTVTLMLLAFVERGRAASGARAARANEIAQRYLLSDGGTEPKLLLTSIDGDMLAYLLGLQEEPADVAVRLQENLDVFRGRMAQPDFDETTFWSGCERLRVLGIELSPEDSSQEVFESLNSKGKRLAVEDLIRNAILSFTIGGAGAQQLYERRWLPLEESVAAAPDLDMEDMLCSWIASRHDEVYLDSKSEVYPLFKDDLVTAYGGDCESLLVDVRVYADELVGSEQLRRDRMAELDRWLQGKPKNIISEKRMFGD